MSIFSFSWLGDDIILPWSVNFGGTKKAAPKVVYISNIEGPLVVGGRAKSSINTVIVSRFGQTFDAPDLNDGVVSRKSNNQL